MSQVGFEVIEDAFVVWVFIDTCQEPFRHHTLDFLPEVGAFGVTSLEHLAGCGVGADTVEKSA